MDPNESFEQVSQHDIGIRKATLLKESRLQTFDIRKCTKNQRARPQNQWTGRAVRGRVVE